MMAGLFGKTPKMPEIEPPAPLPDEEATAAARRRLVTRETKGTGVQSTLLSTGGRETLGG